jgi:hypothetical protein
VSIFRHAVHLDNLAKEVVMIRARLNVATVNFAPRSGSFQGRVASQVSLAVEAAFPLFPVKVVATEKYVKMELANVVHRVRKLVIRDHSTNT